MKYFKIRNLFRAVLLLCLFFTMSFSLCASNEGSASGVDVKEIVLGHMSDAYEWHITTWNGHHISIPLPVIVKGESGDWHVFSSERFHDSTNGTFEGFYLDETHNGKIYEHLANGQNVRPIDLSITKNVVQIWIVVLLMAVIFISSARWYKGRQAGDKAPGGFVGLVEMFVMSINDDLIRPSVGEKHYKQYAPFLLTAFFFIFITNLLGLLPIFPGGANITGNINITFVLAMFTLLLVNVFGNKEYWMEILWPPVPTWLKCPVPMMPVIELFGIFTKPFALMVRLFANMMGGHAIILSLTCVIFITCQLGAVIGTPLTIVSFVMMVFMNCLELLVAFIQAYVFTMLSAVFIGLAHTEHSHE
ncbi:aTP synthase F0 A subunit [Prevotella sp. CAG:5226]|jgi:F-type H+-transporting ATPase subunit a|uniref:F0F1 ATP synthase subunit A n=1 Tax=Prevotellamassilia timonensis TaxID=1852370 RepID=UPI00033C89FF|nr:aTP synthase F0 A subunit [Prevotella sp. CAG:5226]